MGKSLNILFGLMLNISLLLMPKQHASMESQKDKNLFSCCKVQDVPNNCCSHSPHQNNKCEDDCFTNCCCFGVELKNEKILNTDVAFFQYPPKSPDIYQSRYKYLFHYTIYKPPINFIS